MSRRFGAIISGSIIFLLLLPFAGIAKGGGSRLRNSAVSIGGWVSDVNKHLKVTPNQALGIDPP